MSTIGMPPCWYLVSRQSFIDKNFGDGSEFIYYRIIEFKTFEMTTEKFEKLVQERCDKIKNVLTEKAKEYATDKDRLHNFNRGAEIMHEAREKVIHAFMMKHFISYLDMIDGVALGKKYSNEYVDEKLGDIINYFILIEASIKDRNDT